MCLEGAVEVRVIQRELVREGRLVVENSVVVEGMSVEVECLGPQVGRWVGVGVLHHLLVIIVHCGRPVNVYYDSRCLG